MTQDTLLTWPRSVSTSHAFVSAATMTPSQALLLAKPLLARVKRMCKKEIHSGQGSCKAVRARMETAQGQRTIHAPQLDLAVICSRDDEREAGVECCPVDPPVMPLQDILYHRIAAAKQVRIHLRIALARFLTATWRDCWDYRVQAAPGMVPTRAL